MDLELLIKDNIKLVGVAMYKLNLRNDDEAYAIGCEALFKAAINFNKERGVKFSTFAYVCIYNALGMYIRKIVRERDMNMIYYDAPTQAETSILDLIPSTINIEEAFVEKEKIACIRKVLFEYVNTRPSARQRHILNKWIESDFRIKTIEIAESVGVSQCYVSVTIKNARAYIKKKLGVEYNGKGKI